MYIHDVNMTQNYLKIKKMKKVFKEVSKLVQKYGTKKAIAIVIISTIVVIMMMLLSSCNVTRIVTTEASHFQKGDTTTTIVTKTTETYEGTKK